MRCLAFRKRLIKGQLKGEIHMSETIEAAITPLTKELKILGEYAEGKSNV